MAVVAPQLCKEWRPFKIVNRERYRARAQTHQTMRPTATTIDLVGTITWVNHASFVLEHGATRLICDPWAQGTAFDDGWGLLSPSHVPDWETITHVWISHEHPDHFSPRTLESVPQPYRGSITVLYQETRDKKVLGWCRKKGFRAVEVRPSEVVPIGREFDIQVRPHGVADSYMAATVGGRTVLNLNDCVVPDVTAAKGVARSVGVESVDVLLTQFSYAAWVSNPADRESRRRKAVEKLHSMAAQIEALRPAVVVPFASFIWFCHEENRWMNDETVNVARAAEWVVKSGARPVVLYPGDLWMLDDAHDNTFALSRYAADEAALVNRPSTTSPTVCLEDLLVHGCDFVSELARRNTRLGLRTLVAAKALQPVHIWVADLGKSLRLDIKGLRVVDTPADRADISLGSEALDFCFVNLFGGDTLQVNGRFTAPARGSLSRFRRWMSLASYNNRGLNGQHPTALIAEKARALLANYRSRTA